MLAVHVHVLVLVFRSVLRWACSLERVGAGAMKLIVIFSDSDFSEE